MKAALMLLDLQRDFLAAEGLQPAAPAVVDSAARLLATARSRAIPVVHVWLTVQRHPDTRMRHWQAHGTWKCVAGTDGHLPPDELRPLAHEEIVHKTHYSAFEDSRLDNVLRAIGARHLVIAGVHLHACVRATVFDAYRRGFVISVAEDAVASDDPVHAAASRRYLEQRGIRFAPSGHAFDFEEVEAAPELSSLAGIPEAAANWRAQSVDTRIHSFEKLALLLTARREELATTITRETGKPITMARQEVDRSCELIRATIEQARRPTEYEVPDGSRIRRRPHGVVAAITPWNNPLGIPVGKVAPALLFGNAVAWKPSPAVPQTTRLMEDLFREAELPEGVLRLVVGSRRHAIALMEHPKIDAVSLSGSPAAGAAAQDVCGRRHIPLQAELGGNNAAIVWRDAELADAAGCIVDGAFGFAGQRCTANRRLITDEACHDELCARLIEATRDLRWGDPMLRETRMGSMINENAADRFARLVERAERNGAIVHAPHGRSRHKLGRAYHPPIIVCVEDPTQEIVQEESFGPVLVVQRARTWEQAITLCNGVRQGLIAALFSQSIERQENFQAQAQAGILKINRTTSDAGARAPFGGWKASGLGPPEHGPFELGFFTRVQSVYR